MVQRKGRSDRSGDGPGKHGADRSAGKVSDAGAGGNRPGSLALSGIGQGVAGAFQPRAVASGGAASGANTGLGDIGRAGLGAGAASAGQKVADYMIRRAEEYQPVIELRAGTRVSGAAPRSA